MDIRNTPLAGGDLLRPNQAPAQGVEVARNVNLQLTGAADVKAAHTFFQPAGAGPAPPIPGFGGAEASATHVMVNATEGLSVAAAHMAGKLGESAAMGAAQTAGAQAVSPLIQMIMRMPGHIGLLSSMFEALGHFFFGPDLLAALDPLHFITQHAEGAASVFHAISEQIGHMSLLPHHLGGDMHFSEMTDSGSTLHFNEDIYHSSIQGHGIRLSDAAASPRDGLNASGYADVYKPHFEQGGSNPASLSSQGYTSSADRGYLLSDAGTATFRPTMTGQGSSLNFSSPSPVNQQPIQMPGLSPSPTHPLHSLPTAQPPAHSLLKPVSSMPIHRVEPAAVEIPKHAVDDTKPIFETIKNARTEVPHAATSMHPHLLEHSSHSVEHQAAAQSHVAQSHAAHADSHAQAQHADNANTHKNVGHENQISQKHLAQAHPNHHAELHPEAHQAHTNADYVVKHGDSLWKIAHNNLGEGSRWSEIYHLNQASLGNHPELLHAGSHLQMPAREIASADYIVKPGDNLWTISQHHLGGGEHWSELLKANHGTLIHGSLIHPGQHLALGGEHATPSLLSPNTNTAMSASPHPLISHPAISQPAVSHSAVSHSISQHDPHSLIQQAPSHPVQLASNEPHFAQHPITAAPTQPISIQHQFVNVPAANSVPQSVNLTQTYAPHMAPVQDAAAFRPEIILRNHQ
jgi:LysM repeat protein